MTEHGHKAGPKHFISMVNIVSEDCKTQAYGELAHNIMTLIYE